jgi:hypothetical protein
VAAPANAGASSMNLAVPIVGLLAGDTADGSELLQPRYNI